MLWPKVYTNKRYDYHSNPIKGWQNFFQLFVDSVGLHQSVSTGHVSTRVTSQCHQCTWHLVSSWVSDFGHFMFSRPMAVVQFTIIPRCQVWALYEALNVISAKSITLWHHQVGYFIFPVMFIYLKWVIFLQIWRKERVGKCAKQACLNLKFNFESEQN